MALGGVPLGSHEILVILGGSNAPGLGSVVNNHSDHFLYPLRLKGCGIFFQIAELHGLTNGG